MSHKKKKKNNFRGKIDIVLLDFLNISTPVVKDDYLPRKLLKNKKGGKDNTSVYDISISHVLSRLESKKYIYSL